MASFNRVTLIGNLTRDPQSKQLPGNTTVCEFGLAMNHKYKTQGGEDREDVCFVDCAAFGKRAEVIQQYCQKGKPLFIEGRLKYDSWDDKNGGGKRSKLSVIVDNFQFLGDGKQQQGGGDQQPAQKRAPTKRPARQQDEHLDDGEQFKEDDIPFDGAPAR